MKGAPADLLRIAQALNSTLYQIGKGNLEGTLAGEMISLWRGASSSFFKELFGSVFDLESATIYPDRAPFLLGKYSEGLSYGLASAMEVGAEKVILASFRKGFSKAERDIGVSTAFSAPIHKVFPYVGFAKAALGSFFGLRVVPTINYILKEFSLFQSGDNLDALCAVLQKDCVDPVLHWRKEASIHTKRAYHYGYVCGATSAEVSTLTVLSEETCCSTCQKMTWLHIPTELTLFRYNKIAQSNYEDLRRVAPFPTEDSIAQWRDDLASSPFNILPYHPFCNCRFAVTP